VGQEEPVQAEKLLALDGEGGKITDFRWGADTGELLGLPNRRPGEDSVEVLKEAFL
jgi:hypothetical protein